MTPDWMKDGNCASPDYPTSWWFPEPGESAKRALELCGVCLSRSECLEYALNDLDLAGIWGGWSHTARKNYAKRKPPEVHPW